MVGNAVIHRVRDLKPGQRFTLKRTGQRYEFLGYDRRTPGGTLYLARRKGFAAPTTLHHSCHVILDSEPMAFDKATV